MQKLVSYPQFSRNEEYPYPNRHKSSMPAERKVFNAKQAKIADSAPGLLNETPVLAEDQPEYRQAGKYLDPYSALGHRKIFGDKDLLVPFLRHLIRHLLQRELEGNQLDCPSVEMLGLTKEDPSGIYDLSGVNKKGERFIIEMQREFEPYIGARSQYLSALLIQDQAAPQPDLPYHLKKTTVIQIMNFTLDDDQHYERIYQLTEETDGEILDILTHIFLQMPKFNKKEDELEGGLDKWLYAIKNLHKLEKRPKILFEDEFRLLFERTLVAGLTPEEMREYNTSLRG